METQALLVLETDEDYVRFGIPQDRLSPILTVTNSGVELTQRQDLQLSPLPTALSTEQLNNVAVEYNDTNETDSCQADQSECNLQVPCQRCVFLK